jgi:hypothetical protein
MSELRTNDKLYHWRYGLMIVNSLNGPYVNVTIDDPESVKWTSDLVNEHSKRFTKSCLNHWIHITAVKTIDNDNDFDYPGKGIVLPIDGRLFHEGLRKSIAATVKELRGVAQEYERLQELKSKGEKDLLQRQEELETTKNNEAKYEDHDKYNEALYIAEVTIEKAEAFLSAAESKLKEYQSMVDKAISQFGLRKRDTFLEDAKMLLENIMNKASYNSIDLS